MRRGKYARSVSDKSPVGQKQAHGSPVLVKFKAYKRQILTAAALAAIVYVFAAIGILSYLQSNDTVTNRIISKNGSVTLYGYTGFDDSFWNAIVLRVVPADGFLGWRIVSTEVCGPTDLQYDPSIVFVPAA